MIGLDASHAILTSAKEGIGTADVLEASVRDIPPPRGDPDAPATALIFDSWFDPYHGAVVLVRVFDGQLAKGRRIRMMATGKEFLVTRVGVLAPGAVEVAADRKSTRLNSSHRCISYAVFCLKKKKTSMT